MIRFRLYSRPGCHLCEVMLQELASIADKNRIRVEVLNIDDDPELYRKYALRIPVLTLTESDTVLCEQSLNRETIEQLLQQLENNCKDK